MKAERENAHASKPKKRKTLMFTCLSGLRVNALEDTWILLAYHGKGWRVEVGWVHSAKMPDEDRTLILDVFI